jgi:hypothetical protein
MVVVTIDRKNIRTNHIITFLNKYLWKKPCKKMKIKVELDGKLFYWVIKYE